MKPEDHKFACFEQLTLWIMLEQKDLDELLNQISGSHLWTPVIEELKRKLS